MAYRILGVGCIVIAITLFFPVSTYETYSETPYKAAPDGPTSMLQTHYNVTVPTFLFAHPEKVVRWDVMGSLIGAELFLTLGVFCFARSAKSA